MRDDDLIMLPESTVTRAAEITAARARAWAAKGLVEPTLIRQLSERHTVRIYDFGRTVELLVAAELLRRGISHHHIGIVLGNLRERGVDAPLRTLKFATAGHDLYFQWDDGEWEGGRRPGQGVLASTILDLNEVRAKVREAARPDRSKVAGRVQRKRGVVGNKTVFAGTRIPVETVRSYLDAGFDQARILQSFPDLRPADIEYARAVGA